MKFGLPIAGVFMLSSLVTPVEAGGKPTYKSSYKTRGIFAYAYGGYGDECSGTYVDIWASESVTRFASKGKPETFASNYVSISVCEYNWCTEEYEYSCESGDSINGGASFSGDLKKGATVSLNNFALNKCTYNEVTGEEDCVVASTAKGTVKWTPTGATYNGQYTGKLPVA